MAGGDAKKSNASGGECLWLYSPLWCASFADAMCVCFWMFGFYVIVFASYAVWLTL